MFIAIIVPPARESKAIMKVILFSLALSCVFTYVPGFSEIGSGWRIIICGVVSAGLGAYFFPLRSKDTDGQDDREAVI